MTSLLIPSSAWYIAVESVKTGSRGSSKKNLVGRPQILWHPKWERSGSCDIDAERMKHYRRGIGPR